MRVAPGPLPGRLLSWKQQTVSSVGLRTPFLPLSQALRCRDRWRGWWGVLGGEVGKSGQEALGCLFPLFPDSFVAADWLPSSPGHLGSQLISSLMPLA